MYRLTIDGPPVAAWRGAQRSTTPQTMRVYKWEDKTGYFLQNEKYESAWIAEQRALIAHGSGWLLESVQSLGVDAPPPAVDDIWSEEVIKRGNIIAGNSLTIVGNEAEIQDYARRAKLTLPAFPPLASQELPPPAGQELLRPKAEEAADRLGMMPVAPPPLPAFRGAPRPQLPPRAPHLGSSRGPLTHPGSHGLRREEHRLPAHGPPHAHRPEHTGPRPYVRPAGPGPAFRGPYPPRPGPPQQARVHDGSGRPRYEQRQTGQRPHGGACLVVEE
jgi:hypothetical protein